ncbi:hypothetical protein P7C73_g882, partial [Tremellales sp. Uapishka_1]
MAPVTSADKQKYLLQQEIAKLSGAISRHTAGPSRTAYHPYPSRGRGSFTRGRGRGRGGKSYGLDLRTVNKTTVARPAVPSAKPSEKEEGEVSPSPPESPFLVNDENANPADKGKKKEEWIKGTSKRGNMTLMTIEKSNQLLARPPVPKQRRTRLPPHIQALNSIQTSGGSEGRRVAIDGVIFQFEQGGKKLVRVGDASSPVGTSTQAGNFGTPTRLEYGGEQFRRTKRGNLISRKASGSARRAELAKKPCRYYTKTGRCDRALTCPYLHSPSRLSICPKFLRSTCPLTASTCPLSHSPSPHNTPSCVHFQATSSCRNGSECLYPHVKVSDDAPVCEAFAREGWCDRPAGECEDLHVWECGEWRAKGTCARGGKCGLRHVLRSETGKGKLAVEADASQPAAVLPVEGGFEDGGEFISLPSVVVSDEESEGDDSEEEEDEEEDESDESEAEEIEGKEPKPRPSSPSMSASGRGSSPGLEMDTDEMDEDEVLLEVL